MTHRVTLIPGDGIGPEIMEAARRCIDKSGASIEWEVQEAGADVMEKYGTPLPDHVLESIRRNKVAIKGPITTPIGTGLRSVNVALRHALSLYACVRPCKYYPGVRSLYRDVDVVIVRENTEDLYAGVEFDIGSPQVKEIQALAAGKIPDDAAISIKPISITASRRIVKYAFEYALANNRRKVTAGQGQHHEVHRWVVLPGPGGGRGVRGPIAYEEVLVDNMCMQLVQKPELYDVLVMPNSTGTSSPMWLPDWWGLSTHRYLRTDPRFGAHTRVKQGQSDGPGVMMLRYLGEGEAADRLKKAVAAVIAEAST